MKQCSSCLLNKETECFYKHSKFKDGLRNQCKDCCIKKAKIYRNNNHHKITTYQKNYSSLNKEKRAAQARNYRKNNKNARLAHNLRTRLNKAILNFQKVGSAINDLGCSVEEFKIYIESKFDSKMSWDNYGLKGWHIDHIIPLSSFNLNDVNEFKKATHYTNLQPMWAEDNLKKGNKNAESY
jgi:hypothetical protein